MKSHIKKLIAPIVIAAIIAIYLIGFIIACFVVADMPLILKITGCIIPLALTGVCIYVLIERIKEIRSGEEDDLSKY